MERLGLSPLIHSDTTSDLQEILQSKSPSRPPPVCNGTSSGDSPSNNRLPTHPPSIGERGHVVLKYYFFYYLRVALNVDAMDEKFVKLLATQRLQQILASANDSSCPPPSLSLPKTLNGIRQQDTPLAPPTTLLHNKSSKGVKRKRDFGKFMNICMNL